MTFTATSFPRTVRHGPVVAITNIATPFLPLLLLLQPSLTVASWSIWPTTAPTNTDDTALPFKKINPITSRDLQSSLSTIWPTTKYSPLCETWSYLDAGSSSTQEKKWDFLDALTGQLDPLGGSYTDAINLALVAVQTALPEWFEGGEDVGTLLDGRLLRYALSLRAHSPMCELHRTLARDAALSCGLYQPTEITNEWNVDAFMVLYPSGKGSVDVEEMLNWYKEEEVTTEDDVEEEEMYVFLPGELPRYQNSNKKKKDNDDVAAAAAAEKKEEITRCIILYGNMGSEQFADMYTALMEVSATFVVRHMGHIIHEEEIATTPAAIGGGGGISGSSSATKTILQGYGVRLDIRNVEYRAFETDGEDDESDHVSLETLDESVEDGKPLRDEYLGGINLVKLVTRSEDTNLDPNAPDAKLTDVQRSILKTHHQQNQLGKNIPQRWQRTKLALQASTVIATSSDPLVSLQDISQNLPTLASTLVHIPIPDTISDTAEALNMIRRKYSGVAKGDGAFAFYVNGKRIFVDRPSFNLFELLKVLREEDTQMKKMMKKLSSYMNVKALKVVSRALSMGDVALKALGKSKKTQSEEEDDNDSPMAAMMGGSAAASGGSKKYRIDVGRGWKGSILYLNDIEKDMQFRSWPRQVQNILFAAQFGSPPTVRRNLFTILIVMDLVGGTDNPGLDLAVELLQSGYPVRIGVLLVSTNDLENCKTSKSTENICPVDRMKSVNGIPFDSNKRSEFKSTVATTQAAHALLSHLISEYGGMAGLSYLMYITDEIKNKVSSGEKLTMEDLVMFHGTYLKEAQIMSTTEEGELDAMSVLETHSTLDDDDDEEEEDESKPLYGKALRFALNKSIRPGMSFLNGLPLPMPEDNGDGGESNDDEDDDDEDDPSGDISSIMGKMLSEEQNHIARMVMKREITDSSPKSVYAKLLTGDTVFKKHHPLLMKADGGSSATLDLNHGQTDESLLFPSSHKSSSTYDQTDPDGMDAAAFVIDALFELNTLEGLTLVKDLLSIMDTMPMFVGEEVDGDYISVAYRIMGSTEESNATPLAALFRKGSLFDISTLLSIVHALIHDNFVSSIDTIIGTIEDLTEEVRTDLLSVLNEEPMPLLPPYSEQDLPSKNFLLANGRIFIPETNDDIEREDIELLFTMELGKARAMTRLLRPHLNQDGSGFHDAVGRASTYLSTSKMGTRTDVEADLALVERNLEEEEEVEDEGSGGEERKKKNPLHFVWNEDDESEEGSQLQVKVTAVIDPLTEGTQRAAPLLRALRDHLKLPLSIILAPRTELSADDSIPITSYYRFVADPNALNPDVDPPMASFVNLPVNHVLTIRMDVPEQWNVQQIYSVQDTDNLRCSVQGGCGDDVPLDAESGEGGNDDESGGITEGDDENDETTAANDSPADGGGYVKRTDLTRVEYGLSSLLFFGQCYDATKSTTPNGLQLTLSKSGGDATKMKLGDEGEGMTEVEISADGSSSSVTTTPSSSRDGSSSGDMYYSDTLVMKTAGYWQLRANPGVWTLNIAKQSRGAEIYDMVEGEVVSGKVQLSSNATMDNKRIVMKDFLNYGELLLVRRRAGFEDAKLFYDEEKEKGKVKDDEQEDETINVFSLATGHLYERLLKIMMLSVTKRASVPVKFWLFENFLSPSFKETAIDMAKRVGCQVEFVTYKWPEWLRGQSEKQRIIWGYKILFLDVLFPLNVKKIIYVDADQVVRGDLKELWDMDLNGAPYGYTPFCDSRETTLGFQFWRTGFWQTHLRGKPYHISALYVVDLERFRRELVGDRLRHTYQQLSADPNSLANLDQDLPNYAQHEVKIFSLPQEWLWCESWCSDETKSKAKTIDLCNNPLHKEPKVTMAKRVISGELFEESWVELDAEVERYEREYRKTILMTS